MRRSHLDAGCVAAALAVLIVLAVALGMDIVLALGIHYLLPAVPVDKAFVGCMILGILLGWIASAFRK